MMKILSISCIILCTVVIIYAVSIYIEGRRITDPKKEGRKKKKMIY
ncbi:MAG TPA: hypothetical protein VK644_11530 [Chitinophagaceae bacterium]|nr:hypothetical protein [Chitinophagaceae bacterium]